MSLNTYRGDAMNMEQSVTVETHWTLKNIDSSERLDRLIDKLEQTLEKTKQLEKELWQSTLTKQQSLF